MNKVDVEKLILNVLEDGYLMSLGTFDDGGVWVADVIYVHDDHMNLYWLSLPEARHSKALESNSQVACTITAAWDKGKERAVQIEGLAGRAKQEMLEIENKMQLKRGLPASSDPGEVLKNGHIWYFVEPKKIELINNELFGYKKQSIEF